MQYDETNTAATRDAADDKHAWHVMRAPVERRKGGAARRALSLALQGGGSFGAFTWGVLDHLLDSDRFEFDAVSGTSAGAVNAVIFANGLTQGGPEEARRQLEHFWRRMSHSAPISPFGRLGHPAAAAALEISTLIFSPYQFNPLGVNPLREFLADEIDFARLRRESAVRLFIAATRVADGRLRLFREDEITLEAVLASTCLPLLNHAVEIDGDWYWDGSFTANPPLRPLAIDGKADDIMLVQVTPEKYDEVPRFSADITRRVSQITSNSLLHKEIELLYDMVELCRGEGIFDSARCRKLRRLRLHRIAAGDAAEGLAQASALDLDWSFVARLRDSGRKAAAAWLADAESRKAGEA